MLCVVSNGKNSLLPVPLSVRAGCPGRSVDLCSLQGRCTLARSCFACDRAKITRERHIKACSCSLKPRRAIPCLKSKKKESSRMLRFVTSRQEFRRVRFLSVPKLDSRLCPTVFRRMYGALLRVFLVAVHPADLLVAPMYAHVMEFPSKNGGGNF